MSAGNGKPTEFLTVRVPKSLLARIDKLAKADDRSRSNQAKILLESALTAEERRRKTA